MPSESLNIDVRAKTDGSPEAVAKQLDDLENSGDKAQKSVDGLREKLDELGKSGKDAGEGVKEAGRGATEGGKGAEKASTFFSKLGKSLKRIFLYRTIRKVLSEIGQAAREGVTNLYNYSAALGAMDSTHAKTNLDSLATSALYVKNSIGAMLSPVIQAITPIVYQMADAFAVAANAVNQLFAALVGNASFTKAVRFPTEMQKGLSGASGAAKELRRTLLGFDEINRLDMETGGGGGGASGLDYSKMFEESEVSAKAKKLANFLKRILPIALAIGAAFAGWKLSSGFLDKIKGIAPILSKIPASAGLAVAGIALVAAALVDAYKNNESFRTGVDATVSTIKDKFVPWLKSAYQWLSNLTINVGGLKIAIGKLPFENAKQKLQNWSDTILKSIPVVNNIYVALKNLGYIINNCSTLGNTMKAVFQSAFSYLIDKSANVRDRVGNMLSSLLTPLEKIAKLFDKIFNTNYAVTIQELRNFVLGVETRTSGGGATHGGGGRSIGKFASGGFVSSGELFIARENGIPEMVGTIGGNTAVANNDQIVSAIKQGVVEAMSQSGQNINVNVDGKSLFDIIVNRNNSQVRQTGKSPILV